MNREEFKKKIPHGYGKIIAERAKVTPRSVSLFLQGKSNSIKIEMAILQILAELNQEKKKLTDIIK